MAVVYRPTTNFSCTIVIGTYGTNEWSELARDSAVPNAIAQGNAEVVHVHGGTLAAARNAAVQEASGEWIVTLDADDELSEGYCDAILAADGDLRAPALHLIYPDKVVVPDLAGRDIERTNPCCIGTAIRRGMFLAIGGFPELAGWEDWAVYLRAVRRGARLTHVPEAIYQAHVRPGSRNQSVPDAGDLYRHIRATA